MQGLRLCVLGVCVGLVAGVSPLLAQTSVAHYGEDFPDGDQNLATWESGWRYLWNAPDGWTAGGDSGDLTSGPLSDPSGFQPLAATGSVYTPDGDTNYTNNNPAGYLKLTATGGHPGKHDNGDNRVPRCPVVAYKVATPGFYSIGNSGLSVGPASQDGVAVTVFTGPFESRSERVAGPGQTISFDAELGYLGGGEVIYVAVSPGQTAYSDTFLMDFEILRRDGTEVAHYYDDFDAGSPATGWSYGWNAPEGWTSTGEAGLARSGPLGLPGDYQPLAAAGTVLTPDGDTNYTNNDPAGYLKLTKTGGHPGKSDAADVLRGRYAIAGWTVDTAAYYAIEGSALQRLSATAGDIVAFVYPDISEPVAMVRAGTAGAISFDTGIGWLEAGETIYVAVGPGGSAVSDAFDLDYKVVRYDLGSLQAQIDQAVAAGDAEVVLTPGRYYSKSPTRHVVISGETDLAIVADGVALHCQNRNRAVEINACAGLSLAGLTIQDDPPLYVQGVIEDLAADTLEVRLQTGYPFPVEAGAFSGVVYTPGAGGKLNMRSGCYTRYPSKTLPVERLAADLYRIPLANAIYDQASPGDHFTLTLPTGMPHAVAILDSEDVAVRDVTIHGSPSFGVFAFGGPGNLSFERVSVTPRPTPLPATVPPLLSSNADGIHVTNTGGGIVIADCDFAYNGDDCIALTSSYFGVLAVSGSEVTLATKAAHELLVGDELAFYDRAAGTRTVGVVSGVGASTFTQPVAQAVWDQYYPAATINLANVRTVTLEAAPACAPGDYAASLDQANAGFAITGNTIDNTRARGILVKASGYALGGVTDESLIGGNTVTNAWLAGVQLRPEPVNWMEADFSRHVGIEGNTLTRCGLSPNAYGAIRIDLEGLAWDAANGHADLRLEDNLIAGTPGCSLYLRYAGDVTVTDNLFRDSHAEYWVSQTWNESVIWLETVDGVTLTGNVASGLDTTHANVNALVGLGADAVNVQNSGGLILQ